jgi:hypothetical protein
VPIQWIQIGSGLDPQGCQDERGNLLQRIAAIDVHDQIFLPVVIEN